MSTRKHIVGNMTGQADLKFAPSGKAWATFTVASNDGKDDKQVSCFTRCKAFGDLAENIVSSLDKGARVIVEGREQTEEWERDGQKQSMNVLIVDAIGPDLRFATAKVTRNERKGGGFRESAPAGSDPWASAPVSEDTPW